MFGLLTKNPRPMAFAAALGLIASTSEGAPGDARINCPEEVTVDWIQAANGKQNKIATKMRNLIYRDQPNPTLVCRFEPGKAPLIQQLVALKPGSVESACGAKATISGRGVSTGSVPPFGGFVWKSKRIQAIATYNQTTGLCLLTLPIEEDFTFRIKMSQGCRSVGDYAFSCPGSASPVN
jgi:hypothetical protein